MDCSQLGSSICGIFQVRILEWVAKSSTRRSIQSRDQSLIPIQGSNTHLLRLLHYRWILYRWAPGEAYRGPFIHRYFSVANTTLLQGLWLVESWGAKESQIGETANREDRLSEFQCCSRSTVISLRLSNYWNKKTKCLGIMNKEWVYFEFWDSLEVAEK